ncbi:MAG: hypothetical protein ABR535_10680 [Pyrinomonadaceae bacterium]
MGVNNQSLMTDAEIHNFGVEIICTQLEKDGWAIEWADGLADILTQPQIIAEKNGELAFFIVRTAVYPSRGRFEEGQGVFETLVRHAAEHKASCFFASVGIANSEGSTENEMSLAKKGVRFNVEFDGLVKMELPSTGASVM